MLCQDDASSAKYKLIPHNHDNENEEDEKYGEEVPQNVFVHFVPENRKNQWNHIGDLDSFFTDIYYYHQKNGFFCIVLEELLEVLQFLFIVGFTFFLYQCLDYSLLLGNHSPSNNSTVNGKIYISDIVMENCLQNIGGRVHLFLAVVLLWKFCFLAKSFCHLIQLWKIKSFVNCALNIKDKNRKNKLYLLFLPVYVANKFQKDLCNLTWNGVMQRLIEVQYEQQMCIHSRQLTELDIYNRILRFQNYMIALVTRSVLPLKYNVPFLGEITFLSSGLKYNIEFILFWGPWAPFENSWHLHTDYKRAQCRQKLSESISTVILWVGVINFLLCPFIFVWQLLYFFFNYTEFIKRKPGILGMRQWSLYSHCYLRHYNELDFEFKARLNRAYKMASKYLDLFVTPSLGILSRFIVFVSGSLLAVIFLLTVYEETVLHIENMILIITVLSITVTIFHIFIPDENVVWCPEALLQAVLANIHYVPDRWIGFAHTSRVRSEFSALFKYKFVHLLEELFSPILTPIFLCCFLRPRALEMVDFFRHFTVEVANVGDVCSFAQLDVGRHGHPSWAPQSDNLSASMITNAEQQAQDGKTELSLLRFVAANPQWKPPVSSQNYLSEIQSRVEQDLVALNSGAKENLLYKSVNTLYSYGAIFSPMSSSILHPDWLNSNQWQSCDHLLGAVNHLEGSVQNHSALFAILSDTLNLCASSMPLASTLAGKKWYPGQIEGNSDHLNLGATYLWKLHCQNMSISSIKHENPQSSRGKGSGDEPATEVTPLLHLKVLTQK